MILVSYVAILSFFAITFCSLFIIIFKIYEFSPSGMPLEINHLARTSREV